VSVAPAAAVERAPALPAAPRERRRDAPRRPALAAVPAGVDAVTDAARDVLEHTARLQATIPWDRLCAQVKGLRELSEPEQRRALESASARSRSARPLTVLITTGSGTPHPHYRHPATPGDGPAARKASQQAVADVHASYRPSPPPPGARPAG